MTTKSTKKRGRPALPKGEVKAKYVPVRLSDADVKAFMKAMKKSDHKTLSSWIRQTLRDAVSRVSVNR
jgi:peptidyl-tRNA hydrolase